MYRQFKGMRDKCPYYSQMAIYHISIWLYAHVEGLGDPAETASPEALSRCGLCAGLSPCAVGVPKMTHALRSPGNGLLSDSACFRHVSPFTHAVGLYASICPLCRAVNAIPEDSPERPEKSAKAGAKTNTRPRPLF